MELPSQIKYILDLFITNGFEAYVVGGAVRDSLMGKIPNDYDICTSALPEEMREILKDCFIIDFGAKHGTIKIFYKKMPMEITTFRKDGEYKDSRHPDKVEFVKEIKFDLSRRDFTINAIAYNNEYVDYCGGIEDIKKKIIRTVGNPKDRFKEDALRILRAIRFSLTLSFEIEEETKKAIHEQCYELKTISKERILQELTKAIECQNYYKVFEEFFDVFKVIIPEYEIVDDNMKNRIIKLLKLSPNDKFIRFSIMMLPFKENISFFSRNNLNNYLDTNIHKILRRLSFSNQDLRIILVILTNLDMPLQNDEVFLRKMLRKVEYQDFIRLLTMKELLSKVRGLEENYDDMKKLLKDLKLRYHKFDLSSLEINGDDLISIGYPEGKIIGEVLEEFLEKVIIGELSNNHKALMRAAKEKRKSMK